MALEDFVLWNDRGEGGSHAADPGRLRADNLHGGRGLRVPGDGHHPVRVRHHVPHVRFAAGDAAPLPGLHRDPLHVEEEEGPRQCRHPLPHGARRPPRLRVPGTRLRHPVPLRTGIRQ